MCLLAPLAGCAVGPDFVRPAAPDVTTYTESQTAKAIVSKTGEPAQHLQLGQEISAQWWTLFQSPALNSVIGYALRDNRTLAAARATLAAAQESVAAARGALFPQLDVTATLQRRKSPNQQSGDVASNIQSAGSISNLYSLGPTVSYAADVFGATRRSVEQQQALAEAQGYQLAAAYLSLTGNVVSQAILMASLRAQIRAMEEVIGNDKQILSLVRREFEAGKVARTDVLTAQTQLASDRALLPPLRQQLSSARHALAILSGHPPAAVSTPAFELKDFTLPGSLPLSLPSKLVRQRPDILAAEAQLHADSAAVGVATAQLFPSITLSASLGQESLNTDTLFNATNRFWNLSAGVLAPIFRGGTLRAQRRAAIETYRASLATYEQIVLESFQQVADTLRALAHDAELVDAQRLVLDSASESLRLQRAGYVAGKTTVLSLIDAERVYQQARLGLARARAQRLQDSAQLFVALGGGWWHARG